MFDTWTPNNSRNFILSV